MRNAARAELNRERTRLRRSLAQAAAASLLAETRPARAERLLVEQACAVLDELLSAALTGDGRPAEGAG